MLGGSWNSCAILMTAARIKSRASGCIQVEEGSLILEKQPAEVVRAHLNPNLLHSYLRCESDTSLALAVSIVKVKNCHVFGEGIVVGAVAQR